MKTEPGIIIEDGKKIPVLQYWKEKYSRKNLEQLLEKGATSFLIYPFGKEDGNVRTVAEGFIIPGGFFFFEIGWNDPDYNGFGAAHLVEGDISEVHVTDDYQIYWRIGKYEAVLEVNLDDTTRFDEYRKAMEGGWKDDPNRNRDYARKLTKEYVGMTV